MIRKWVSAGVVFAAAALLAAGVAAGEPAKGEPAPKRLETKELAAMMTRVHKGEKAAFTRAAAELKKDKPDWDQLAKDAKEFVGMGATLKVSANPYTNPQGYIAAAGDLAKAVGAKDAKAAAGAFAALGKSCSACHYGNPVK
jgi:hypothetical protein